MDEGAGSISSFCQLLTHCVGGRGHGVDEEAPTLPRQATPYLKNEEGFMDKGAGSSSSLCPLLILCVGGRRHSEDERCRDHGHRYSNNEMDWKNGAQEAL